MSLFVLAFIYSQIIITNTMSEKRIPNFTFAEKEVLMKIILSKYAGLLEDKKTNKTSVVKKQEVWNEIEAEFNNKGPIVAFRRQDQLKRLYENKKKELRKKMASYKNLQYKTGGGPPPDEPKLDIVEEALLKIINEKSVCGYSTPFDCDAEEEPPQNSNIETEVILVDTCNDGNIQEYEFKPGEFQQLEIEIPDGYERKGQRCPPSGLEGPISKKLKVLPISSQREITLNFSQSTASTSCSKPVTSNTSGSGNKDKSTPVSQLTLQTPTTPKTLPSHRRRPMGGVRTLTSSDVSEKYNLLLDKRLVLVERQMEQTVESTAFTKEEHEHKIRILKLQEENLCLEKEEKILKIELLKAEIKNKNCNV